MDHKNCLAHEGHAWHRGHGEDALSAHPSRRELLTGLTVLGAGALFPWAQSLAQNGGNPRRIDVHHHFTSPAYLEFTRKYGQGGGGGRGRGGNAGGRGGGALGSALG